MTTKSNLRVLAVVAALASTASCGGVDKTDGTATADGLMNRVSVIARVDATPEDITAGVYSPIEFAAAALQETCSSKPADTTKRADPWSWVNQYYRGSQAYSANDAEDNGSGRFSLALEWLGDWDAEVVRRNGRDPADGVGPASWGEVCGIESGPVGPFLRWAETHTLG